MKLPWQLDDATICYEKTGTGADPRLGIAVRGSIALRNIRLSNYDVSVKDICMSGVDEAILIELDLLEKLGCKNIFVTNRYKSIKIWINRSSKELNAAVVCPFANAVISNAARVGYQMGIAGFASVALPVVRTAITASDKAKLAFKGVDFAVRLGTEAVPPVAKGRSTVNGLAGNSLGIMTNVKAAIFNKKDSDISFAGLPVQNSELYSKKNRSNKIRELLHKAKNRLMPDKLIIRVGSEFYRHHAECVIDLGVRAIAVHDLIAFLAVYEERGKLIVSMMFLIQLLFLAEFRLFRNYGEAGKSIRF